MDEGECWEPLDRGGNRFQYLALDHVPSAAGHPLLILAIDWWKGPGKNCWGLWRLDLDAPAHKELLWTHAHQVGAITAYGGGKPGWYAATKLGTVVSGTLALGNSSGVWISGGYDHTIGGTAAGAGNLISGNNGHGILISNEDTRGIQVQGNYIGVDASGSASLGNGADGIHIERSHSNTIGGAGSGAGNVISANAGDGVEIAFSEAVSNAIQGNAIGTDESAVTSLGNGGHGISLTNNAGATTIGGTGAGEGNAITANVGNGVTLCFSCSGTAISDGPRPNFA